MLLKEDILGFFWLKTDSILFLFKNDSDLSLSEIDLIFVSLTKGNVDFNSFFLLESFNFWSLKEDFNFLFLAENKFDSFFSIANISFCSSKINLDDLESLPSNKSLWVLFLKIGDFGLFWPTTELGFLSGKFFSFEYFLCCIGMSSLSSYRIIIFVS